MKKFLFLFVESFSMFLLVFMGFFVLRPLNLNAQALPQVSQYTFQVIEGGIQDALEVGSQYKGISPYTDGIIATYEVLGELYKQYHNSTFDSFALWTCDNDDVIVTSLEDSSYFEDLIIYDRYGNLISDVSNIYYVSYDNGFFSGGVYIDNNGDILYNQPTNELNQRLLGNIAFGGNLVEWEDFNNFYDLLLDEASNNQMNFSFSDVDYSDLSFLCWMGASDNGGDVRRFTVYIYCPNALDFGNVQVNTEGGISRNEVIFNPGANFVYELTTPSTIANTGILQRTVNGYSYSNYVGVDLYRLNNPNRNFSYSEFMSYNPQFGENIYCTFAYHNNITQEKVNSILNSNADIVSFVPLILPDEGAIINPSPIPNELIDLSDLSEIVNNPENEIVNNPDFVPGESIEPLNYPIYIPMYVPNLNPSSLPNNGLNDNPNDDSNINPSPGENIGDIGGINLPFIENLKNRFPFSIPFDIYNLISGLSVQREAPSFEWEIYLPIIDYNWVVSFDLSSWDNQALIFRTCFLILFIIGLALWSYNHFFGS